MAWIDRFGDRDSDGFQEYQTRSSHGMYNQGWKDAGDAIPEADGTLAPLPIATCELQGYVFDAKNRMADIYDVLERPKDARRLRRAAQRLYDRFNDIFWWEQEGTYYLGLNGRKEPIRSVASNAGHLLQSGIVPPERAGRVVRRLMADDMWSGWGIRTLSTDHPAYNPFSYHTGSVWPHDNATAAGGFRRYGYADEAAQVAKGIFDAAERLVGLRLPELFSGSAARSGEFPGAVSRCERAAGVGGRLGVPVRRDPVRPPRDRRRGWRQAVREPGAARLAARDRDPQPAGRRGVDGDPLPRRDRRGHLEHLTVSRSSTPRPPARSAVAARSWHSQRMQADDDPAVVKAPWGPEVDGRRLLNEAVGFGRALRAAGLHIDLGAAVDYARALTLVDMGSREQVRAAGEAVFVRRRDDRETYDVVFDRWWRSRGRRPGDFQAPPLRHPDGTETEGDGHDG